MYDAIAFDARSGTRQKTAMQRDEVWRPIPGFENYEASNLGRIRRVPHDTLVMRPDCRPYTKHLPGRAVGASFSSGAMKVTLYREGTKNSCDVAFLISETFRGPAPGGHVVSFLDGNPRNTQLANLVWRLRKDVVARAIYTKPRGRPRKRASE